MVDTMGSGTPKRRGGVFWWFRERSGRAEYWLYVAICFGLSFILGQISDSASVSMTGIMLFVQARRLHDLGRTGWWALAVTFGPVAVMLPFLVLGLFTATLVGIAVEVALMILLGALPGEPGENRFGRPRPFTWKGTLTGR